MTTGDYGRWPPAATDTRFTTAAWRGETGTRPFGQKITELMGPKGEATAVHRSHRRCCPHAGRQAPTATLGLALRRHRRRVLKALVERNNLDPALVKDVIMGCVLAVDNQSVNVGRSAVLAAGFPDTVPATTIDRQCGSAAVGPLRRPGRHGRGYDIVIAAGVEVMSTTPMESVGHPRQLPDGPQDHGRYAPSAASS